MGVATISTYYTEWNEKHRENSESNAEKNPKKTEMKATAKTIQTKIKDQIGGNVWSSPKFNSRKITSKNYNHKFSGQSLELV